MINQAKSVDTVSIIIPTYNEQGTIGEIIDQTKKLQQLFPIEIIIADGGSIDRTVAIAKEKNAKIFTAGKKRGKGIDFWEASKEAKGKYIVQIDADLQFKPSEIPLLIKSLQSGADIAIAVRKSHKKAPLIRTLGNKIFVILTSIILQRVIFDVVAGFKAFKKDVLFSLKLQDHHFGYEAEIVVKGIRMGYKLDQIPVSYRNRTKGESQVQPLRDGFLTILSIIKYRFSKLPRRIK